MFQQVFVSVCAGRDFILITGNSKRGLRGRKSPQTSLIRFLFAYEGVVSIAQYFSLCDYLSRHRTLHEFRVISWKTCAELRIPGRVVVHGAEAGGQDLHAHGDTY